MGAAVQFPQILALSSSLVLSSSIVDFILFLPASRDAGNRITHVTTIIGDHL
jgi:hypothetical protein